MNLRILKKLSKRAAPLLPQLGYHREQFRSERGDNYTGLLIMARKHWERGRSTHADLISQCEIKTPAKDGRGWIYQKPPAHPRKGTVMVGSVQGYYEPEWYEETAWEALEQLVSAHFTDWTEDGIDGPWPHPTRALNTPTAIFAAAAELIAKGVKGGLHG